PGPGHDPVRRPVRHGPDRGRAPSPRLGVPAGRAFVRSGVRRPGRCRPRSGLRRHPSLTIRSRRGASLFAVITHPRGPFVAGDQVQLTDPKGRQHRLVLTPGRSFHTHRGALAHDDLIGKPEGSLVTSAGGTPYIAFRPLLADYSVSMVRGAAVVYPK